MTTTLRLTRRFVSDYARNRVNLLLLVVVPAVFVVMIADSLANAARLLGGDGPRVATATAGWAAAMLAGTAMYFQIADTRGVDRRLVTSGLRAGRLVGARLLTGLALASVASIAALVALALRTGIGEPARVISGTLMFGVIYIAIGAAVGSIARKPVNGTVAILFIWILDVFFGPAMSAGDRLVTRALPTHFVTMWMVDLPAHHGGRVGDLGWALAWTVTALVTAWLVVVARTRVSQRSRRPRGAAAQRRAAGRAAWRDARRNPVVWVLFVVVPAVFVLLADAVTPNEPITIVLREHRARAGRVFSMPDVHAATMAPIAVASLAALVGVFAMLDSRDGDRRAVIAGLRPRALLTARLSVLAASALAATVAALSFTAFVFQPTRWATYAAANALLALTYGLVGALLAPVFGRVGGVFIAFLLPFLDLGITQSPMLHPEPTALARLLPGYGGSRVLLDGALTSGFDETRALVTGLVWLAVLATAVIVVFHRATAVHAASHDRAALQ